MAANNKPKYPSFDFLLTGARFVLGSLTEKQTKDQQGRDRANPILFAAFAVDKRTPGVDAHIGNIIGYARHTYGFVPNGQQVGPRLAQPNFMSKSGFAWKLKDGDADSAWAQREGCRGCWIFLCQTSLDTIRCCDQNNAQLDPKAIGLGDYCDVYIGVQVNGEVGETAGIYLNPNGVRLVGYGQRIVPAGQSFDQMFGQPAQLPPGASPTPVGGAPVPQGWQAPQAAPQGYGQAAPGYAPPPNPTPAPQGGYAPTAGYGNAGAPAPAGQYGAPPQQGYAPPAAQPGAAHGMPTYPQHSGGYPQAGGQPGMPMPPAGGVPGAYPSSPAPNGYPPQPGSYPQAPHAGAQGAPVGAGPAPAYAPSAAAGSYPTAYPSNPGFVQGPR
jgi:hypothetical protein